MPRGRADRRGTESPQPQPPSLGPVQVDKMGPSGLARVLRVDPELLDHPIERTAARRLLRDPQNHLWLAAVRGRDVGLLRAVELCQLHTTRKQMFLYEVAVASAYRHRGVGSALVRAMLAHCRRHGFEEAFVFTDDPRNRAAHTLYRSTGAVTETRGDRMYIYRIPRDGSK
jgi:ribosomal protein S18 acetylase RimI-like enzyme